MKNFTKDIAFTFALICSLFFLKSETIYAQDCSDLMVSEIVFGINSTTSKSATENTQSIGGLPLEINHSIEVFNPTDESIDLSIYSIDLVPPEGEKTILYLSGLVPSKETFVISNFHSKSDISDVSNVLDLLLSFEGKVALELSKNGVPIDVFGDEMSLTEIASNVDLANILNDPTGAFSDLNINLSSIKNLTLRRKQDVQKGSADFSTSKFIEEWEIASSQMTLDLGDHINACNSTYLRVSWAENPIIVTEGSSFGTTFVFADILLDGYCENDFKIYIEFAAFGPPVANANATNAFDFEIKYGWQYYEHTVGSGDYYDETVTILLDEIVDDWEVEGTEYCYYQLTIVSDADLGISIAPFSDPLLLLIIEDDDGTGIADLNYSQEIKIAPNLIESQTLISSKDEILEISVFNEKGQKIIFINDINDYEYSVLLSNFAQGQYYFLVTTNNGVALKKAIKT